MKHSAGKHTYGKYGHKGALSRIRSAKNSQIYMLNEPPPMWTLSKSQQITMNKLFSTGDLLCE